MGLVPVPNKPGEQRQPTLPAAATVFVLHVKHDIAPAREYVLPVHAMHDEAEVAPMEDKKVPTGHALNTINDALKMKQVMKSVPVQTGFNVSAPSLE